MSQPKKSIDEIWKELNQRPAAKSRIGTTGNVTSTTPGSISIPGLGTIPRVNPPPKTSNLPLDASHIEEVPIAASNTVKIAGNYDPTKAGVTQEEFNAYLATIQRLVNCLSDQDRSTRRQAAVTLQSKLVSGDASMPAAQPAMLQALVAGPLLNPLLLLLRDIVEKCRLVAVELWSHAAAHTSDLTPVLPSLFPELARRMGHLPVQETAEEVKLGLMQLTALLIQRAPVSMLTAALPDIMLILCRSQEDGYHEIKKAGAAAIANLATRVPGSAISSHSAKLAVSLVANLTHQHAKVRAAVLEALDKLIAAGGLPAGALRETVVPGLRPIAHDRAPAVREALFSAVAGWLGANAVIQQTSNNGVVSNESKPAVHTHHLNEDEIVELLPLLLTGVSDPQLSTAALALRLVEAVGETQHAQQNGGEPSPDSTAMQVDLPPTTPQQPTPTVADMETNEVADETVNANSTQVPSAEAAVAACLLGPPFNGRPAQGARHMARQRLPSLLVPLIKDLTGWTVAQRAAAARSLHTLMVLAEDAVQGSLPSLLPALCSAVGDEDVGVAQRVVLCSRVIGAYVKPNLWLPLMMDHLCNTRLTLESRLNALVVLSALLHAAGSAGQALALQNLTQLANTLASEDVWGTMLVASSATHPAATAQAAPGHTSVSVRDPGAATTQLLAVLSNLLRWQGTACQTVSLPLCKLTLALWSCQPQTVSAAEVTAPTAMQQANLTQGVDADSMAVQQQQQVSLTSVQSVMQQLVVCCGSSSWQEFLDRHASALLQELLPGVGSWSPDGGNFLVLRALLLTSGPSTLAGLAAPLLHAIKPTLSDQEDKATLRLALLQLFDVVLDNPNGNGKGLAADDDAAMRLLDCALLPPLTWRAGKTAAAIRFAAITALASALRRQLLPAKPIMRLISDGTLLPLIAQELDEDWYVDVRHATCYVVHQLLLLVGPRLGHDPRRAIYIELLKRLDDSSNTVRIAACNALQAFCTTMQSDYCETNAGYLAAGVVIHMDDADTAVQEAAVGVMQALGRVKPQVVRTEILKVRERFRSKHCCDQVLASLPTA